MCETVEKDHGRIEIRRYALSDNLGWLAQKPEWAGLRAVGRVGSTRVIGGQTTTGCRHYLGSRTGLERFADVVRGHWAIENGRHWVLDVQFGEDANRARKDHSAENLGLVRRMALNVIRHNGPSNPHQRRLAAYSARASGLIVGGCFGKQFLAAVSKPWIFPGHPESAIKGPICHMQMPTQRRFDDRNAQRDGKQAPDGSLFVGVRGQQIRQQGGPTAKWKPTKRQEP